MTEPHVTIHMTEPLREAWASEPMVDGVALLEQIRAGMDAILAREWRPELHDRFLQALADTKRALLAEGDDQEALIEVLDRPFAPPPPHPPRVLLREKAREWLQKRGARFEPAWGFLIPAAVGGAINTRSTSSEVGQPAASDGGIFGRILRMSPAPDGLGTLVSIDFHQLPKVAGAATTVLIMRNDTGELLGEATFDESSGLKTAILQLDPELIATRQLRVAIGVRPS